MLHKFTVVVEKDPETGWLVGEVVGLRGCYTQAPDRESLIANLQDAIQTYLQSAVDEEIPGEVETLEIEVPVG